jgi:two-component system KDP operon response regulator KdpE
MPSPEILPRFNVLVVDDEPSLRKVIRTSLSATGYGVQEVANGADAVAAFTRGDFDIVLLDINLVGTDGVDTCRQIRAIAPRAGIIMVTVRDDEEDQVRALDAGADDYVTKPFHFRELLARLGAVLRRTHPARNVEPSSLHVGDLRIDFGRRTLWKSDQKIRLSHKEFDLLAFLMKHQGAPVTHIKLLRGVWGPEYGGELEYLRTYIRILRKKIEDDPAKPEYITTEAWVGYRFRNPTEFLHSV